MSSAGRQLRVVTRNDQALGPGKLFHGFLAHHNLGGGTARVKLSGAAAQTGFVLLGFMGQ